MVCVVGGTCGKSSWLSEKLCSAAPPEHSAARYSAGLQAAENRGERQRKTAK